MKFFFSRKPKDLPSWFVVISGFYEEYGSISKYGTYYATIVKAKTQSEVFKLAYASLSESLNSDAVIVTFYQVTKNEV